MASTDSVSEPFPIFKLAHRYLLYDINTVSYIRAKYNITGVLIGGLPQAPQQNVFSGIPLELMPEEARLLVEKGVAHIVDDVKAHKRDFLNGGLGEEEKRVYRESLRRQGVAAARQAEKKTEDRSKAALGKKLGVSDWNDIPEDMLKPTSKQSGGNKKKKGRREPGAAATSGASTPAVEETEDSLFGSNTETNPQRQISRIPTNTSSFGPPAYAVTPTISYPPMIAPPPHNGHSDNASGSSDDCTPPLSDCSISTLPEVPPSYPLFKHLHTKNYFLAPGLRFGCQYMAYPGDPLRFHSHFLCNGMDWDQEFDLLDLVGGGRLGTGVKKGYLIGGARKDEGRNGGMDGEGARGGDGGGEVKTFCIEWAGM